MTLVATFVSSIKRVPVSYFVYSSFAFFGRQHGGELPGGWFIAALTDVGRDEAAIRQTLYRMEREGELVSRKVGRMKWYRPSGYAAAEIDAGTGKIFDKPAIEWDGQWTMVRVGLRTPATATQRERVIALLAVEGFAQLDANLFVHPRNAAERLLNALSTSARKDVVIMRGELQDATVLPSLVSLWNVEELAARYRRVLFTLAKIESRLSSGEFSDRDAFVLRFAVVFEYLGVAWDDPGLPDAVLPSDWPAPKAREVASELYERLLPRAVRHADALLKDVTPLDNSTRTRR